MTEALEARQSTVSFGGVRACDQIDLTVRDGEVVGLTGPRFCRNYVRPGSR